MSSPDYTRDAVEQFYWCFAEVNVGILCAAAPALKPFFMRYLPALLRSSVASGGGTHTNGISGVESKVRRKTHSQSYELRSGDGPHRASDETELWTGNGSGKGARSRVVDHSKTDLDASSLESMDARGGGRNTVVVSTGQAKVLGGDGISVVKETTVDYAPR